MLLRTAPILATFAFASCWNPRVYGYSWGRIVVADERSVSQFCSPEAGTWDNGSPKPKGASVIGCAQRSGDQCEIWIQDTNDGFRALPHELAHCDGVSNPKAEGYDD